MQADFWTGAQLSQPSSLKQQTALQLQPGGCHPQGRPLCAVLETEQNAGQKSEEWNLKQNENPICGSTSRIMMPSQNLPKYTKLKEGLDLESVPIAGQLALILMV